MASTASMVMTMALAMVVLMGLVLKVMPAAAVVT